MEKKFELSKKDVVEKWGKDYPKVEIWLSKIQRKNHNCWFLWRYCKLVGKDPDELLALKKDSQSKEAEYLLDGIVANESLTNAIRVAIVIAVKSFYKWNYTELARASGQITFVKQKPYRRHTKEELLKIHRAAQNPRDRALITFVWSTAIAKDTLTKIKWQNLESGWEQIEIPHIGLPDTMIKGHGIGKYKGVEQHTFLTPEAKKDLIDYKNWLERIKDVKFNSTDNVFVEVHRPFKPITEDILSNINRVLSENSEIEFSWHDARRYVETALEETKINPNWARKIRGRKVKGEEAPYSRPAINQLREAYRQAIPLLQFTQPTQMMDLEKRQKAIEDLMAGLTEEQKAQVSKYGLRLGLRKKTFEKRLSKKDCEDGNCGEVFEQIPENELIGHLRNGWTIIHKLASGDLVVKK